MTNFKYVLIFIKLNVPIKSVTVFNVLINPKCYDQKWYAILSVLKM